MLAFQLLRIQGGGVVEPHDRSFPSGTTFTTQKVAIIPAQTGSNDEIEMWYSGDYGWSRGYEPKNITNHLISSATVGLFSVILNVVLVAWLFSRWDRRSRVRNHKKKLLEKDLEIAVEIPTNSDGEKGEKAKDWSGDSARRQEALQNNEQLKGISRAFGDQIERKVPRDAGSGIVLNLGKNFDKCMIFEPIGFSNPANTEDGSTRTLAQSVEREQHKTIPLDNLKSLR